MSMKLAAVALGFLLEVQGARKRVSQKTFHGVPVFNYRTDVKEWVIKFKKGSTDGSLKKACAGHCTLMGQPNAGGTAFVKFVGNEEDVAKVVFEHPDEMEFIEPDEIDYLIPEVEPEDDERERNTFELGASRSWGLDRIGVPTRPSAGAGAHVYVVDTGVRNSHQDFGGRVIPFLDMTSGRKVLCKGSLTCAVDGQGHGTHCAGTVGGTTFGVASEATIHAARTLNNQGSGSRSWQVAAIDEVVARGLKPSVMSMSLGGSGTDPMYTSAIGDATEQGITVVVAAGNSNSNSCSFSPAFVATAITVGATDSNNKRASYSNYGKCNNIMAPGSYITSASFSSDTGAATMSGTSMACPHVAGAAALLIESGLTNRDTILQEMVAKGSTGVLTGLKTDDPNVLLFVGAGASATGSPTEPPPPTKCPSWSRYPNPDSDGDCGCGWGKYCSKNGAGGPKNCPTSRGTGGWGGRYFQMTCSECMCY